MRNAFVILCLIASATSSSAVSRAASFMRFGERGRNQDRRQRRESGWLRGGLLMRVPLALSFLALGALLPATARSGLIGSFGENVDSPNANGASATANVRLCFTALLPFPDPTTCSHAGAPPYLFEDLVLSTADAGATFVASTASDPDFAAAAGYLTNGVNDDVEVDWGPVGGTNTGSYSGSGQTESVRFFGGDFGIDFAGYVIESISMTLSNDFSVTPDFGADRTAITGSIQVQVFGQIVPEPSPLVLLALGFGALASRRRRQRPRRAARAAMTPA
jgi:hypothetical protein